MKIGGQIHAAVVLLSVKEHPLHIEQVADRAAEPVWTWQWRQKSLLFMAILRFRWP